MWKRSSVILLLLLSVCLPLWSADGARDPSEMTTQEIVLELSGIFEKQQTELEEAKTSLSLSLGQLELSKTESAKLRALSAQQQTELNQLSADLEELRISLPSLLAEQEKKISRQETWLWILGSVLIATAAGTALSFVLK